MECEKWFEQSKTGRYAAACELDFFRRQTAGKHFQAALQTNLPQWRLAEQAVCNGLDFLMNTDAIPFPDNCINLLILPHTLENGRPEHATLNEAYRVLDDEGLLILTGFNPHSIWWLLYRTEGRALPGQARHLPFHETKAALTETGFSLTETEWLACWPPTENGRHTAGWPAVALIYGLTASKHRAGIRPLQAGLPDTVGGMGDFAFGGI